MAAVDFLPSMPDALKHLSLETMEEKDFLTALNASFETLVEDFVNEVKQKHALPQESLDRLRKMFTYNCLGGKVCNKLILPSLTPV